MFTLDTDVLLAIDTLSTEKRISKNTIFEAIESAFKKELSKYYPVDGEFIVKMDRQNGSISFYEKKFVVSTNQVGQGEISITEARGIEPNVEENGYVLVSLPKLDGTIMPISALRRGVFNAIKVAQKEAEYDEFKKREGELITGTARRVSPTSVIVNVGNGAEAILGRADLMRVDDYKIGDKVRAYIKSVDRQDKDLCQIVLSRTDNNFLAMLIAENVVEIQDGLVDIKAVARKCGEKAKVAVISNDGRLDAVGACIGAKGSRIKPVVDELHGERVDIVYWDRDVVNFAKNAIVPAKALYGTYNENTGGIELVVADDQLKLAIGKSGMNVRLASQLVGCNISVVAESEKKKAIQEKQQKAIVVMASALDIEDVVAQFLVSSNIVSPKDLIAVGADKLVQSGVFNEEIANELVNRAQTYVAEQEKIKAEKFTKLNIDNAVLELDGMNDDIALLLGEAGVKNVQDIADLDNDEFVEICGEQYQDLANRIIMDARQRVYNF